MSAAMDRSNWPLLLIEGVLVFGGALLFGWWQLRSVARDQQETARRRAVEAQQEAQGSDPTAAPSARPIPTGSGTTDTSNDNRA